ncbi:MAG: hypothetical protein FWE60_01535 [Oscillospiraceae bacterium]|nr:hypothetical protein [Oscillospiraceae bacterium]
MKKAKRLLGIILAVSFIAGLMSVPAQADEEAMARVYAAADAYLEANSGNWANTKWLQIWERVADFCGVDIMLPQLVETIGSRAGEGYYRFTFVANGGHPRLGYPAFKIVTAGGNGEDNFRYLRFSDWYNRPFPNGKTREEMTHEEITAIIANDVAIISYNDNRVDGHGNINTPTSGMIPAGIIMSAAAESHNMRFISQNDIFDFVLKEIVVEHFPDGQNSKGAVIYRMSSDPVFQGLPIFSEFEGDGGMVKVSGSATFYVVDAATADTSPFHPAREWKVADALTALKMSVGEIPQNLAFDIDRSGRVNTRTALLILLAVL